MLPVSGRTAELLPRVHVYVVKSVGLALVTLQVSVVELPSCTTGGDAVSSISGITGVGKRIVICKPLNWLLQPKGLTGYKAIAEQ